jgi:anaphase-promoting complex subunit 5
VIPAFTLWFPYLTTNAQQCDQASSTIEQLLKALWHSEFHGRLNLYRTAIILFADVSLEFGLTKRSRDVLEAIMPQVSDSAL